ncbi:MAG: DUF5003 domain-containing protein [Bacteroidales bacterium]|nr:DUF5003 domain-containing protein [Bacteroidales bacterium]
MKKNFYTLALAAVAALTIFSCAEKPSPKPGPDPEPEVLPVFPKMQEVLCGADQDKSISFNASHDWTLVSDKIWCTFDTPSGFIQNTQGEAGEVTVKIKIGSEGLTFETAATCNLTMTMAGKSEVIAQITRSAKGYEFSICDENGVAINEIVAGYEQYNSFTVKANFAFAAVSWNSEVFSVENDAIVGDENTPAVGKIKIIPDGTREKYAIGKDANYTIVFSNESGSAKYTYPVIYAGMDSEAVTLTLPTKFPHSWVYSVDGKTLSQPPFPPAVDTTVIATGCYEFEVACFNDDFNIVTYSGKEANPQWVHVAINGTKVGITVDENEDDKARRFEVWAFSKSLYTSCGGTAEALYDVIYPAEGASEEAYEKSYILSNTCFAFQAEQGFIDRYAEDGQLTPICLRTDLGRIPGTWEYDRDAAFLTVTRIYDKELMKRFNVYSAYEVDFTSPFFLMPQIEGWNEDTYGAGTATVDFYWNGRTLEFERKEIEYQTVHQIYGINNQASMQFYGPSSDDPNVPSSPADWMGEKVYGVFKVNDVPKKLVVINPPAVE